MSLDSLIPKNRSNLGGHAVTVSTGGGHQGFGNQNQQQQSQAGYVTPGSQIRNFLSGQGGGGGSASFNWKTHGGGAESSEVLAKMLNGAEVDDTNSREYYLDKVAPYMFHFTEAIARGKSQTMFYQHFIDVRDNFFVDLNTQSVCQVKKEFVDVIVKIHDFKRTIGYNGSFIFGYLLTEHLKKTGADDWTERDVHSACQLAISHVMSFEFINWLVSTKKGRSWHNRLPPAIDKALSHLEGMKEQFAEMWDLLEQPFPYAQLTFSKSTSAPLEYHRVFDPSNYGDSFGRTVGDYAQPSGSGYDEIYADINRNVKQRHGIVEEPRSNVTANNQEVLNEVGATMSTIRYDYPNITRSNMHTFDWLKEFRTIGRPNHYWVCDSSWRYLQHLFPRHPEQRQDEATSKYVWRIVIIDLDGDRVWQTTNVRSEILTVQYLMSNPTLLLPLLEKSETENAVVPVQVIPVDVVDIQNKLEVPVEQVRELTDATPVIAMADTLVGKETAELLTNVDLTTRSLTKHFNGRRAAVATGLAEWDTYSLKPDEQEVKIRLFQDMPFLFNDAGEKAGSVSLYQAGRKLQSYFSENIIPDGLKGFINGRLTDVVNQWLVNEMGYNVVPGKGGNDKLQIGSFIGDYQELTDYLKDTDEMAYGFMHDGATPSSLTKGLKIFYYNNPYGQDPEEMPPLDRLKAEIQLFVVRDMLMINIINDEGLSYDEPNVPGYIRRSVWPDLFQMVEESMAKIMPDEDPVNVDKLLRFSVSGHIWVFSYTSTDRNTATLRHVSNKKPLVLLSQD